MYSAEIRNQNTSHGTIFGAYTAIGAKLIIDLGQIVFHLDGSGLAVLFALFTTDTTVGTLGTNRRALLGIIAGHEHPLYIRQDLNNSSGTDLGAKAATDTLSRINMGNPLFQTNRFLRANLSAISKTDTTIYALSASAI